MEALFKSILENMGLIVEFELDTKLDELGVDSLMLLELIVEIEDKMEFSFDEEDFELENFATVESLFRTVRKYVDVIE